MAADLKAISRTLTSTQSRPPALSTQTTPSIAVLPFTNLSADREQEYFCDGIAEEIINALTHVEGLRVVARTSAFAFKGKSEDLRLIGEKLNVSTVLEGSVRRAGDRLRITAQLVNVSDGYHLWSERYDRDLTDVFAIQDDIATSIAAKFKVRPAEEQGVTVKRGTENLEAYEIFLKGRALQWKRGPTVRQAFACFERAVALDPGYGEALAWMADSIRLSGLFGLAAPELTMPRAKDMAERALKMDPDLDEAHATLADVALLYDHDEATAFRYWERALSLNPGHLRARCERAFWGLACVRGAIRDALAEVEIATESDPLGSYVAFMHALILGVGGYYDDALPRARRACELDPEAFLANWGLVQACSLAGDHLGAVAAAQRSLAATGRHQWLLGTLAFAYGLAERHDAADAILAELRARAHLEYVQPTWIAVAAIGAGKLEEAMALAETGVDERDPMIVTALALPNWAPLRVHPRFGDLRKRMGFV
jgi:serine/threonine-protein kinase